MPRKLSKGNKKGIVFNFLNFFNFFNFLKYPFERIYINDNRSSEPYWRLCGAVSRTSTRIEPYTLVWGGYAIAVCVSGAAVSPVLSKMGDIGVVLPAGGGD